MEEAVRITPEQFDTIRTVFFGIVVLFMIFVGIQILGFEHRRRHPQPPPRRPPPPPGGEPGDANATFGISGIGAFDMSTSTSDGGMSVESVGSDSGGDFSGGDSGGGGDFSGGGGDGGGGGSSGGWND